MSDKSNEVMTVEELQNAFGRFMLKVDSLVDGMGVLKNAVGDHERHLMRHDEEISSMRNDFEAEKARNRDRERIEADEVNHISEAIKSRVVDLLSGIDRFDTYGRFAAKCRADAKRYSYYRGRNGVDTKMMYYGELLEYIGKWTPEGYGGVVGYVNHLDRLKDKK